MTADAYERVTAAIERVTGHRPWQGGDWRCPAHDDSTASLSVSRGDGRVLLHCHAGCSKDDVLAKLGLRVAELFDEQHPNDRPAISDVYGYRDETGALLYEVVRMCPKDFRARRPDGRGGHVWNLKDVRRVLYRLPELLEARNAGATTVYVVEGEKDVEAVRRAGGLATCNSGGAGKWRAEYAAHLAGFAQVVIVADRDEPGRAHAAQVVATIHDVVEIVVVEALEGKDAADHLAAGHSLEELQPIDPAELDILRNDRTPPPRERDARYGISADPATEPDETSVGAQLRAQTIESRLLRPSDVDQLEDPGWLIQRYIPAGGLATVFGRPGSYKTFLALDWACSVASGAWWNRNPVAQGAVLYVMAEGVGGLRRRKQAWETHHRVQLDQFPLYWYPQPINLLDDEWSEGLATVAGRHHCRLVIIDTVARAMPGGDENASRDMGKLIAAADLTRTTTGGAVILVHHTPLDGSRLRGHSSLEGAVDTNIAVETDGTTIKITVDKQKDAEPPDPLYLHPEQAVDSIVLAPGSAPAGHLPPAVLEMLRALADLDIGGMGTTNSAWVDCQKGVAPRTAQRHIKRLLETGHCHMVTGQPGERGARYGLTDQGKEALNQ